MSSQCTPNPDVAGIGDVAAFIAASLVTITAATFAAMGIQYRRAHQHSEFLNTLLSGLSTTQLVYGGAILFALFRQHERGFTLTIIQENPYWHLTVYMMLASISSGFACALALQLNGDVFKAKLRTLFFLTFIILYCILLAVGYDRTPTAEFCESLIMTLLGLFCSLWVVIQWWRKRLGKISVSLLMALQITSVLTGVIKTIRLRWHGYGNQPADCLLNTPANNKLDFGQFIAIALTSSILIQVLDAFLDNIEDDLAKPVLQTIGVYNLLKKMKQTAEPIENGTSGSIELQNHAA